MLHRRQRRVLAIIVGLVSIVFLQASAGLVWDFCPACSTCPSEYTEEIGHANCEECEIEPCWIFWPVSRGWPWWANIADHLRIPDTQYTCWHTTTCIDEKCLPLQCEF